MPISLSDSELTAVMDAARPLPVKLSIACKTNAAQTLRSRQCWVLPLQLAFGHDWCRGLAFAFADKASGQAQRRNDQGHGDSDFFHSQPSS
jgi:hypothetical protein